MRRLILKGHIYGSELLAQQFTKPEHLWGRPMSLDLTSFTDEEGNPVMYAWATNKSPAGDEENALVQERIDALLEADPSMEGTPIPVDLVTVSGSGLDPEISPEAAAYQVHRIAQARGMSEEDVQAVIDEYTTGRFLGILCDLFDELPTVLYLPEGTAMSSCSGMWPISSGTSSTAWGVWPHRWTNICRFAFTAPRIPGRRRS